MVLQRLERQAPSYPSFDSNTLMTSRSKNSAVKKKGPP